MAQHYPVTMQQLGAALSTLERSILDKGLHWEQPRAITMHPNSVDQLGFDAGQSLVADRTNDPHGPTQWRIFGIPIIPAPWCLRDGAIVRLYDGSDWIVRFD